MLQELTKANAKQLSHSLDDLNRRNFKSKEANLALFTFYAVIRLSMIGVLIQASEHRTAKKIWTFPLNTTDLIFILLQSMSGDISFLFDL